MILKIIFWIIVSIASIFLVGFLFWWSTITLSDDSAFISFKLVKTGYELNPERWEWDNTQPSVGVSIDQYGSRRWFRLHLIDWINAFFFFQRKRNEKLKKIHQDKIVEVLEIIQKDVDVLIKKSQQEQEEALKEMEKVAHQMAATENSGKGDSI